jgi:hypothetical protein
MADAIASVEARCADRHLESPEIIVVEGAWHFLKARFSVWFFHPEI